MFDSLEDNFIEKMIDQTLVVTVFLTCGVKLDGVIVNHDKDVLLLRKDKHPQLVYKKAISTIMPSSDVTL